MNIPSPIQELTWKPLLDRGVKLFVKRDDLIHPFISGNKWRKLSLNISEAKQAGQDTLLTFGGAYSNHILATAAACSEHGLKSIGIIRGDELDETSNPMLAQSSRLGMRLIFVDRETYTWRNERSYHQELWNDLGSFFVVPEGGANFNGVMGCLTILREQAANFDHVFCASGTGTTAAGLMIGASESKIHAVNVLKGIGTSEILKRLYLSMFDEHLADDLLKEHVVHDDFHFGGYAKWNKDLLSVMRDFSDQTGVRTDPIYTAKTIVGIKEVVERGEITKGESILFVHTGGLSAIPGFEIRNKVILY